MNTQEFLIENGDYSILEHYFESSNFKNVLLVCGHSIEKLKINSALKKMEEEGITKFTRFRDFQPNPQYESVVKGIEVFKRGNCDAILAVGGGSAMDVAKCIKLFCSMDPNSLYLQQSIVPNQIPLLAVPTTSGTGSEATRFAVIYYEGEKQSVSDYSCIPSTVIFDPSTLESLPDYQRKVTMLDAFCHGIESFWSVHSTDESKEYSKAAITKVLESMDSYLANEPDGNRQMLQASTIAGKAINITQTTAGHAMCYKLTSMYHLAHGHAAALCVSKIWSYMAKNLHKCVDPRGEDYLRKTMLDLSRTMGCTTIEDGAERFENILNEMNLAIPDAAESDHEVLKKSVNPVRLKNHPIQLDELAIEQLYREILTKERK